MKRKKILLIFAIALPLVAGSSWLQSTVDADFLRRNEVMIRIDKHAE